MKKIKFSVAVLLTVAALIPLQSCIGSFALTNRVLSWNKQVGSKFVNELVFFAFWVLPVYEVTSIADLIVLNSIEFWSGSNPVDQASVKTVDTNEGSYLIASDETGYTVTSPDGTEVRLEYMPDDNTWCVMSNGEAFPFMTMIDDSHVKNKDFATADSIRDALGAQHIALLDTPQGTIWEKI